MSKIISENFLLKKLKGGVDMTYEKSCGAIVFSVENEVIKYVLVQQKEGFWAFPKGHVKPSETEEECAVREISEEVGLSVRLLEGFREVDEHRIPDKDIVKQIIYFCARYSMQKITVQTSELLNAESVPFEEAGKLLIGSEENSAYWQSRVKLLEKADKFIKAYLFAAEIRLGRKFEEMMLNDDGDGFVDGLFYGFEDDF